MVLLLGGPATQQTGSILQLCARLSLSPPQVPHWQSDVPGDNITTILRVVAGHIRLIVSGLAEW
eukprot:scaffold18931_cov62-Attheya_sp.AAC.12